MKRIFPWLVVLAMITIVFGTVYVSVQQAQRSEANSPQIQLSQDVAALLDDKADPQVLMHDQIDIKKSLKPFTVIYDKKAKPVAGSGFINSKLPRVDKGVLENSKGKAYNAVSWTPAKDTRAAAVVVESKNFYVLSARSLKEVEKNENTSFQLSLLGWMLSVVLLGVLFILNSRTRDNI